MVQRVKQKVINNIFELISKNISLRPDVGMLIIDAKSTERHVVQ